MSFDLAIEVRGVSKSFDLAASPLSRLRSVFAEALGLRTFTAQPEKTARRFEALKNVSFDVRRGETLGIVGRNGSGKSTLLQIVCGTLRASQGSVRTAGSIAPLLELGAGFNPNFTGRENVFLNAALLGLTREQIRDRFAAIEAFADIGAFIDRPVRTYSSGMFVRLAFATAIHTEPDILVIDEALSVGDEAFQRKCFSRIEDIKAAGGTILFVSHGAQTVLELCDRAILLDRGSKVSEGPPKGVIADYQKLLSLPEDEAMRFRAEMAMRGEGGHAADNPAAGAISDGGGQDALQAFFDPELRSQSVVEYPSKGVSISGSRITTPDGEPVNCLVRGERYVYRYEVRFDAAMQDIAFGMYVKTPTGAGLGGGSTEQVKAQRLAEAEAGDRFTVSFPFTCALTPGVYFTNSGVYGPSPDGRDFLHRVLDATAFRVQPELESLAYGPLDLSVSCSLEPVSPSREAS